MVSVPFPNNGQNKNFKKDFNSENSGLVPPQNVQAEEAVLGGILPVSYTHLRAHETS